jgi:glutaredoxin 3
MKVPADVVIYRTRYCGYCVRAKRLLEQKGSPFQEIDVSGDRDRRAWLADATGRRTVPQIFINGRHIGGFQELAALDRRGQLDALLAEDPEPLTVPRAGVRKF